MKPALGSAGRTLGREDLPRHRPRLSIRRLALLALLPAIAGCGQVSISAANTNAGSLLTIYSGMPLQGPAAPQAAQIVNGEKLALWQSGGEVGPFKVGLLVVDDASIASPQQGWSPKETAGNAKEAARDPTTIAYLGDYDSGATTYSLPLTNAAGILQVSPASPFVGLTSSRDSGPDDPGRFYPTGRRTFGRIMPADPVQAQAQAQLMRLLHIRRVYVLGDGDAFEQPLSKLVAEEARRAGVTVIADEVTPTAEGPDKASSFSAQTKRILASGAQAVSYAGAAGPGAVTLWRELHAADPRLALLASSTAYTTSTFTSAIGSAASVTYITTPILPVDLYPPSARRVLAEYRARFDEQPQPYALYGYEAMSAVLAAIRAAGSRGNEREAVIKSFFAIRNRDSVLGRYSIEPDGETTLSTYAVDRVSHGRPVFWRELDAPS